ncbi:hypothetical protein H7I01_14960, partial [Mycobacterium palustre]|nr:hypothetical protein [Mycobacterium palustre]
MWCGRRSSPRPVGRCLRSRARSAEVTTIATAPSVSWQQLTDDQREAMQAVLRGRDLLAVMPTGSGDEYWQRMADWHRALYDNGFFGLSWPRD